MFDIIRCKSWNDNFNNKAANHINDDGGFSLFIDIYKVGTFAIIPAYIHTLKTQLISNFCDVIFTEIPNFKNFVDYVVIWKR